MIYELTNKDLIINYECRNFCILEYHGHKKGCPNFNVSEKCPPKADLIENFIDLNKKIWFITEEFNLKEHCNKMKLKHPFWTDKQLKNLLYWQNSVRKNLNIKTTEFINNHIDNKQLIYTLLPEAMGVMVVDTALKLDIPIQKRPIDKIIKISLIGYKKQPHDKYEES